jgi:NADH-quinone oxidoreductase subunit N
VYEGAPTTVTAFMSAATNVAAFALALRVLQTAFPQELYLWGWAFAGIAVASLAIGNLAALVQRNVKRMLAYSSISHAGFLLIGLSAGTALGGRALMYYLIVYAAMAFGSFAVVAARERELGEPVTLDNLAGFGWERPFLGVAMWFFLFGFAGLPLGGGFVAKFYVLSAAYQHGWTWLVIVGVVATLVSLYYYLAVVRAMYMRPSAELHLAPVGGSPPREPLLHIAVGVALAVSVGSLFAVGPVIDLAKHAVNALPF